MSKIAIFINLRDLMTSEYHVDIFRMPEAICDYLSKTLNEIKINRKYVFISTPANEQQARFANLMVQNKFDVISLDHMSKAIDVAITTRIVSDAHRDIFDIGVIVSGNISLYPAIREVRSIGKQVLIAQFSDKVSAIYKETNHETGPLDFDIFYLDSVLEIIAEKIIDSEISEEIILNEVKNEFFNGNIDYKRIDLHKYITYWAIRARYLQINQESMIEEDQSIIRRMFNILNDLSAKYRPGHVKALNRKWCPASWEDEIRMVPKIW